MNKYYYIGENPTVDLILVNYKKEILLIKRANNVDTCANMWALPGGFIDSNSNKGEKWIMNIETPDKAALRELYEETGINLFNQSPLFFNTYSGNNRDPRDNDISFSKSHVFYYHLNEQDFIICNSHLKIQENETQDIQWIPIDNINNLKLAFDHNIIINDFLK